jgi:hypothetical protein
MSPLKSLSRNPLQRTLRLARRGVLGPDHHKIGELSQSRENGLRGPT